MSWNSQEMEFAYKFSHQSIQLELKVCALQYSVWHVWEWRTTGVSRLRIDYLFTWKTKKSPGEGIKIQMFWANLRQLKNRYELFLQLPLLNLFHNNLRVFCSCRVDGWGGKVSFPHDLLFCARDINW